MGSSRFLRPLQIDLRNQRSRAGPVYARARRRTESATQDLVPRDHGTLHHTKTARREALLRGHSLTVSRTSTYVAAYLTSGKHRRVHVRVG